MRFYLTTAIPYVNAKPHIGFAMELVEADVIARYRRQKGDEVFFIYGADENSLKNVQAAQKEGITTQQLCDRNAQAFLDLGKLYNISFDHFQRTTAPEHFLSAQDLWTRCADAGDIYKKKYKGLYCVGCEQFYTLDELNEKGECHEHPGRKLDEIEEENYFFKLSKYQGQLAKILNSDEYKIVPEHRKNEALGFIKQGLEDFSISRSKERAHNWGVPVPGDPDQIMYVWFDALNYYRTAAESGNNQTGQDWWPPNLHIIGKGIIRFHAIYWPAMLLSAKLTLPKELFVHGYITVNGQKMSKSLGNTVDPVELVQKYGVDAVRYYLLREIPSDGDGDFSDEKFKLRYNADLANGLGNFASRVLTLAEKLGEIGFASPEFAAEITAANNQAKVAVTKGIEERKLHESLAAIWSLVSFGDRYLAENKPWSLVTGSNEQRLILVNALEILNNVRQLLKIFLPETAGKIDACMHPVDGKMSVVKPTQPLFPRLY